MNTNVVTTALKAAEPQSQRPHARIRPLRAPASDTASTCSVATPIVAAAPSGGVRCDGGKLRGASAGGSGGRVMMQASFARVNGR